MSIMALQLTSGGLAVARDVIPLGRSQLRGNALGVTHEKLVKGSTVNAPLSSGRG
jgi:hypothetical protein